LTDISLLANGISVSAISVSASVSATLDIGYIGIGQKLANVHGYRPKVKLACIDFPNILGFRGIHGRPSGGQLAKPLQKKFLNLWKAIPS
jgi:hypothetical protein